MKARLKSRKQGCFFEACTAVVNTKQQTLSPSLKSDCLMFVKHAPPSVFYSRRERSYPRKYRPALRTAERPPRSPWRPRQRRKRRGSSPSGTRSTWTSSLNSLSESRGDFQLHQRSGGGSQSSRSFFEFRSIFF